VLACVALPAFANPFSFKTITNPTDPDFTQLLGINNSSVIAGYYGDGTVVSNNGFTLVLPNSFTVENFPGAVQTPVVGINNKGETVGFFIDGAGVQHGFTNIGGTFLPVSNPFTTTVTQLLGVNDSGEAAGYWSDGAGNFHPFTWIPGKFTPISIKGSVSAQATGVDNAGDVIGFNLTSATTSDGFLDIGGTFTTLDFPGSSFTQALGIITGTKWWAVTSTFWVTCTDLFMTLQQCLIHPSTTRSASGPQPLMEPMTWVSWSDSTRRVPW